MRHFNRPNILTSNLFTNVTISLLFHILPIYNTEAIYFTSNVTEQQITLLDDQNKEFKTIVKKIEDEEKEIEKEYKTMIRNLCEQDIDFFEKNKEYIEQLNAKRNDILAMLDFLVNMNGKCLKDRKDFRIASANINGDDFDQLVRTKKNDLIDVRRVLALDEYGDVNSNESYTQFEDFLRSKNLIERYGLSLTSYTKKNCYFKKYAPKCSEEVRRGLIKMVDYQIEMLESISPPIQNSSVTITVEVKKFI